MTRKDKFEKYINIAKQHANHVTENTDNWKQLLELSGRLYKYPFHEQLQIHAQKPDATACASYDLWNSHMHRYVKKGTKGIVLLDPSGTNADIKHVFDVADTGAVRDNARMPIPWQIDKHNEDMLVGELYNRYNLKGVFSESAIADWMGDDNTIDITHQLADYIQNISSDVVADYLTYNGERITAKMDEIQLDISMDELTAVISASTAYTVMHRCGIDTDKYFNDDSLNAITALSSLSAEDLSIIIGTPTGNASQEILRTIESIVKTYEREADIERGYDHEQTYIGLSLEGGLSDPERRSIEDRPTANPVGHDEESIFREAPPSGVRGNDSLGTSIPPLLGSGGTSRGNVDVSHGGTTEERPTAGQSNEHDGVGRTHEQPTSSSRGTNQERFNIRVDQDNQEETLKEPSVKDGSFSYAKKTEVEHTKNNNVIIVDEDTNAIIPSEADQKMLAEKAEEKHNSLQPTNTTTQTKTTEIEALAEVFKRPDQKNTIHYAHDDDGKLIISNGFMVIKPQEQDIDVLTQQINEQRNEALPPLVATENSKMLDVFKQASMTDYAIDPDRNFVINPIHGNSAEDIFFSDGDKYFLYNKSYVDLFPQGASLFVDQGQNFESSKHKLVIKNTEGETLGVILPKALNENAYKNERLKNEFPLDKPYPIAEAETALTNTPVLPTEPDTAREVLLQLAEKHALKERENTHGYADTMPTHQKESVLNELNKPFNTSEYGQQSLKEFIHLSIQDGKKIEAVEALLPELQGIGAGEYMRSMPKDTAKENGERNKARQFHSNIISDVDGTKTHIDSPSAVWLLENHPMLHYDVYQDISVIPDELKGIEYHIDGENENTYYNVSEIAYDYSRYLIENNILQQTEPEQEQQKTATQATVHATAEQEQAEHEAILYSNQDVPPVFFVDWATSQFDFNLNKYNDGDTLGFNKDGVEYSVGKMDDGFTYITTTTNITPWGQVLGSNSVIPKDVWEVMNAYHNGDITADQVREKYMEVLKEPTTESTVSIDNPQEYKMPTAWENHFNEKEQPTRTTKTQQDTQLTLDGLNEQVAPKGNTTWQIYSELAKEHNGRIPLIQLGNTYDVMGEDAYKVAKALNLPIAGRDVGLQERVPLCSIPEYRIEDSIDLLTESNISLVVRHTGGTITTHDAEATEPEKGIAEPDTPSETTVMDNGMPDSTITIEDRNAYGYTTFDEMLPLNADRAIELFNQGYEIFRLNKNDTEMTVESLDDITAHSYKQGIFGIESSEWKRANEIQTPAPEKESAIETQEQTEKEVETQGFAYSAPVTERVEFQSDIYKTINKIYSDLQNEQPEDNIGRTPTQNKEVSDTPNNSNNYVITDIHLGEGGAKAKYAYNIEAIKLLKTLEAEGRMATPEEQETLSKYVGWGGISNVFSPDADAKGWGKEAVELKEILTENEYSMARASTLNAHYTSPVVIQSMYETLEGMGFKEGNVLEPAMGIGNFFGAMPDTMRDSKLYGVELDPITGSIAQHLYPNADIKVTGFEKTNMPDSFFDVAIGNVPFGEYKINDKKHPNMNIHDFFFAKSLDQVRPGGIVAFVTSKGTLDKANSAVRTELAQKADLLGAIRLPNNAFQKNAGTEVTTDIIFLQKRENVRDMNNMPEWVNVGKTEYGVPLNNYFLENPHMVLGKMEFNRNMYGNLTETACIPIEGADLASQLKEAIKHIKGDYQEPDLDAVGEEETKPRKSIPAIPSVKNFSFTVIDDTVYFREDSKMFEVETNATALERIKGMVELRDTAKQLIDMQVNGASDSDIQVVQGELNELYDDFTAKHGLINDKGNHMAFRADSSYYLLSALEVLHDDKKFERKADFFTKRTINQYTPITSVDTASEALMVTITEKARVDIDYMADLTRKMPEQLIKELEGVMFCDIGNPNKYAPDFDPETMKIYEKYPLVTADEYLSGNVREKLAKAQAMLEEHGENFHGIDIAKNIEALKGVQPIDLEVADISVRLGSTWIDPTYINQFMYETLETSGRNQDKAWGNKNEVIKAEYSGATGQWAISNKKREWANINIDTKYGTKAMNAYELIECSLNLRDARVYQDGEDGKRVLNPEATAAAVAKQEELKEAFKDWIFKDPDRREKLVSLYNERFNNTRPREYNGEHIQFVGMNPEIKLKEHQRNAIARILYGGNTLLAHEVGAGKTYEMVGAAMESKRLGLCNKSLMVVPNHLTEQTASEILRLYPTANILVATKKDFETANRKKFCARIATGDYDMVVIGHSQFEKIPLSHERQEAFIRNQIDEITHAAEVEKLKRDGSRFTVKEMEKKKKNLETKLEKLNGSKRDDIVTFEQLGIDKLIVDESHFYKNLYTQTSMRNVVGVQTTEAQKSNDMFMKCQYMDEITGGKGIVFATGTPITNSMTEMFTLQRYLQYAELEKKGLLHFDAWASTFGDTKTALELAPEGNTYRQRTRFSRFQNLPELMTMFGEVADIKTAAVLNLQRPNATFETIVAKPSDIQVEMVKALSRRAEQVQKRQVDVSEDNMLKITTDGRKIGLDQRLKNPLAPDDPTSKVNLCMENISRIYHDTTDKGIGNLTQMVFCDYSTPKESIWIPSKEQKEEMRNMSNSQKAEYMDNYCKKTAEAYVKGDYPAPFNIYDDIKAKLILKGIPHYEIAFIHEANTEEQKKDIFAKVQSGKIRVFFGSTEKCGAGTNIQKRLIALHDLDCPWRPSDLVQRDGRILRQGNENPDVNIFRYVTESTFDSYLFQTIEKKQEFISQIMTNNSPVRSCDDIDGDALNYAEIKALCAGNPLIKEKMQLDVDLAQLKMLKKQHTNTVFRLQNSFNKTIPHSIAVAKENIKGYTADIETLKANTHKTEDGISPMTINGVQYTNSKEAGEALLTAIKNGYDKHTDELSIGKYRGFDMSVKYDHFNDTFVCKLKGEMSYKAELSANPIGCISRINNELERMEERKETNEQNLLTYETQHTKTQEEMNKPFPQEDVYKAKMTRLAEVETLLASDKDLPEAETGEQPAGEEATIEPKAPAADGNQDKVETLADKLEKANTATAVDDVVNQSTVKNVAPDVKTPTTDNKQLEKEKAIDAPKKDVPGTGDKQAPKPGTRASEKKVENPAQTASKKKRDHNADL